VNTTAPALRPMGLGDLLDTTFALYRQNFVLFAGVVALLTVPQTLLDMILVLLIPKATSVSATGATIVDTNLAVTAGALSAIRALVGFVFGFLITGALALAVSARYLGRQMAVEDAYAEVGLRSLVSLALASIVAGILIVIGFLFLVIPGVYLIVRWIFIPETVVLERKGAFAALSRSGELVRGSWWRVAGIGLVLFLLTAFLQAALGGIVGAILSLGSGTTGKLVGDAIQGVVRILIYPIELGGLVLLYYDLRIRKEGFDLQQMVKTMETPPYEL
jgi:Membrane domain of glycerophosphoryl diester phosphodiesterase